MSSGRENLAGNVAGRPRMPSFISGKTQIERLFTEPARIHKQKACAATYTAAAHAFVRRSVTEEGYPPLRRRRGSGRPTASTVPRRCGLCQAAAYTRGIAQCRRRSSGAMHRQAASCGKAAPAGRHSRLWSAGCRGRPGPPGSPLRRPQTHIPEPDSKTGCRR